MLPISINLDMTYRFTDEGSDVVGSLLHDHLIQLLCESCRILFLRFSGIAILPVVRCRNVANPGEWQRAKTFVHRLHTRHRSTCDGNSVVGLLSGDNHLPIRLTYSIPIVPSKFYVCVIGVRASARHEDFLYTQVTRKTHKLLRILLGSLCSPVPKGVLVSQLLHLLGGGLDDALVAVAESVAPQASKTIQILLARPTQYLVFHKTNFVSKRRRRRKRANVGGEISQAGLKLTCRRHKRLLLFP